MSEITKRSYKTQDDPIKGDLLNIVSKKEAIDRSFAKEHNLEFDGTEYDYIRELIGKINTQ